MHSGVLIFDPITNSSDYTSMGGLSGLATWDGGVLAPSNGKIYGIPMIADSVLIIDPATNTLDITSIIVQTPPTPTTDLISGFYKWCGGVYVPSTRKIYGIPSTRTGVCIEHGHNTLLRHLPSTVLLLLSRHRLLSHIQTFAVFPRYC